MDCALQEYLKIVDIVAQFDARILTVKGWGVTLSLVAIGLGFKEKLWGYFVVAVISGIAFWTIEYSMKGHQMRYYPRMREIEHVCAQVYTNHNKNIALAPRIDVSWEYSKDILNGKLDPTTAAKRPPQLRGEYEYFGTWRRAFLKHVMMPHILSVLFGLLFGVLAYMRVWRFKEYKD